MKSDFKFIEDEMNSLAESMVEIQLYSSEIDQEIRESRSAIRKLVATADNLRRVSKKCLLVPTISLFSLDTCLRCHQRFESS